MFPLSPSIFFSPFHPLSIRLKSFWILNILWILPKDSCYISIAYFKGLTQCSYTRNFSYCLFPPEIGFGIYHPKTSCRLMIASFRTRHCDFLIFKINSWNCSLVILCRIELIFFWSLWSANESLVHLIPIAYFLFLIQDWLSPGPKSCSGRALFHKLSEFFILMDVILLLSKRIPFISKA